MLACLVPAERLSQWCGERYRPLTFVRFRGAIDDARLRGVAHASVHGERSERLVNVSTAQPADFAPPQAKAEREANRQL